MTPFLYLLLLSAGYLVAKYLLPFFFVVLQEAGAVKKNWQERFIPSMAGLSFPLLLTLVFLPLLFFEQTGSVLLVSLFAVYGAAFLGLLDDALGDSGPRGLRGHFLLLWRQKKISTGVIKALGSGAIALWVVFSQEGGLLDWLLILLSVNFINLLDLRPGRAVKGTAFLLFLSLFLSLSDYRLLAATAGILLAYTRYDLQGLVMLGDTGSNTLGMICGLVLMPAPATAKAVLVAMLALFHLLAEKYSFSVLIEKNALLRGLDRWGREK